MEVGFFLVLGGLGGVEVRFWRSFGVEWRWMTVSFESRLSDDDDWAGLGLEKVTEVMGPVVEVVVVVHEVEVDAVVYRNEVVIMVLELVAVTIPVLGTSKIDPCATRPPGCTAETSTVVGSGTSMSMSRSVSVSVKFVVGSLVLSVVSVLVLSVAFVLVTVFVALGLATVRVVALVLVPSLLSLWLVELIAAPVPTQSEVEDLKGTALADILLSRAEEGNPLFGSY